MEAYLDVCIARCPNCASYYAEASWYAINLGSDLECGKCKASFSAKECLTDRVTIRFKLKDGKIKALDIYGG
jgi:hypothetical protein